MNSLNQILSVKKSSNSKGFTLIELLVVAAVIGILLAIAIPNLIKARISANHANAKKSVQTLRDAEYEYFEGDLDNNGERDFTDLVGNSSTASSLRCPYNPPCDSFDELLDASFEGMVVASGVMISDCPDSKAGYCLTFTDELSVSDLIGDFGWELSPRAVGKSGNFDFAGFADKLIVCTVSTQPLSSPGTFEATRTSNVCPD